MAQITTTVHNFTLTSTWRVLDNPIPPPTYVSTTPTIEQITLWFDLSAIPAGSTITAVNVYATIGSAATGAKIQEIGMDGDPDWHYWNGSTTYLGAVKAAFDDGKTGINGWWRFQANGDQWSAGNRSSSQEYSDVRMVIDYTPPTTTTKTTPPTSITFSSNGVAPNASVTMSWSGAKAGTNNAITGYVVDEFLSTTQQWRRVGTYTTTSCTVIALQGNGEQKLFRIYTMGAAGYDYYSDWSGLSAELTTAFTAPGVPPNVTLSATYVSGGDVTLSWGQASNGTNNPVTGYYIYRNGTHIGTTTSRTYSVTANSAGGSYLYRVIARGAHSNSDQSAEVILYTYSQPSVPGNLTISPSSVDAGTNSTLSWSAASNGHYNTVSGYQVQRKIGGGAWANLGSVQTGLTKTVTASSTMGEVHSYRVITVGARSNSAASSAVSQTSITYTAPSTPSNVKLSQYAVVQGSSSTLSWSASTAGVNNPVKHYSILRNSVEIQTTANLSYAVTSNPTKGGTYAYSVKAIGTKTSFSSSQSASVTLATYGDPVQPSVVTIGGGTTTVYMGAISRPKIALSWSGAAQGTHAGITKYEIYRDGALLASVQTTQTSGSYELSNPEDGSYTIRTVASSGLKSGASVQRSIASIAEPGAVTFSTTHSGHTNSDAGYAWNAAPAVPNASIRYQLVQKVNNSRIVNLTFDKQERTYSLPVSELAQIQRGDYVQLGVKARAYATGGGYTDPPSGTTNGYVFSPLNASWYVTIPSQPTLAVAQDIDGNPTYSYSTIIGSFAHTVQSKGANIASFSVEYQTVINGALFSTNITRGSVLSKEFTHNISNLGVGTNIYYRITATDIYGLTSNAIVTAPVKKLVLPTVSINSFVITGVPSAQGQVNFTVGNGGVGRALRYRVFLHYGGNNMLLKDYTSIAAPGTGTIETPADLSILTLNSGGLTALYKDVITDKKVEPLLTVVVEVSDNQTQPIESNIGASSQSVKANYKTPLIITGALAIKNHNNPSLTYINGGDTISYQPGTLVVDWKNAAGTATGKSLTYSIKTMNGARTVTGIPATFTETYPETNVDNTTPGVTYELTITQNYASGIAPTKDTIAAPKLLIKRFITPRLVLSEVSRETETTWTAVVSTSDVKSGGSTTVNNVQSISGVTIKSGGATVPLSAYVFDITSNTLRVNGSSTVGSRTLTNLSALTENDTTITMEATLTLTSGRTIKITANPFLLKALGAVLALRKTRVGINVTPKTFLDQINQPALTIEENQANMTGLQLHINSSSGNATGAGIQLKDTATQTSGRFAFKDNEFTFDRTLRASSTYGSWLQGKTRASIMIPPIVGTSYSPALLMDSVNGHTFNFGGAGDRIGFYGYYADRTVNGTDWQFYVETNNGDWKMSHDLYTRNYLVLNADNFTSFVTPSAIGAAAQSHGNHVPTTQTASNAVFLRNDNTWQTVTPAGIGAATSGHNHSGLYSELDSSMDRTVASLGDVNANTVTREWGLTGVNSTNRPFNDYAYVNTVKYSDRVLQVAYGYATDNLAFRTYYPSTWRNWKQVLHSANFNDYSPTLTGSGASGTWSISVTGNAGTATKLATARAINGTNFDGSAAITTANWGTARNLTIGATAKSVNGSAAVSWTLAEIGAAAASHSHAGTTSTSGWTTHTTAIGNITLGPANSGYNHIYGSLDVPFYFNRDVLVASGKQVLHSGNYLDYVYPVGAIYMSLTATSPATLFGGTWAAIGAGTFLVAAGTGYAAGATGGGSHSHPLTSAYGQYVGTSSGEAAYRYKNTATWSANYKTVGSSGTGITANQTTGMVIGGTTDGTTALPPYYAVYMWRRTA